jgi:curli biogenesis system outer membrane secretion channel CsgG
MSLGFVALLALGLGAEAEAAAGLRRNKPVYTPSGSWEGYFLNERGVARPVLHPVEQNKDKEWMDLRFTEYGGPKIRLAVMGVENKTAGAEAADETRAVTVTENPAEVPVSAIDEMLTSAVMSTRRFEMVERSAIEALLSEQDLGASGRVAQGSAAETGKLIGAEYLLFASVNEWTPNKSQVGGAGGSGRGALSAIGAQKSQAEVSMSFRVVDVSTGQVLFATTERATLGNWKIGLGGSDGSAAGVLGYEKKTPIGYAVQACMNKGIYKVAYWFQDRPWRGAVMKVGEGRVYINAGRNSGVAEGMVLSALSEGSKLVDPVTGTVLGAETQRVGTLRVVQVEDKYSVAEIAQGCEKLKVGDKVELTPAASTSASMP